jgi:hypothetical protein
MTVITIIKDLLKVVIDIATPILNEVEKDGFQVTDLLAFINSEDFKASLQAFINDILKKNKPQ